MKTNYHTHCNFCDGIKTPRDYALEAINRGFISLGFSSHAPLEGEDEWTMNPKLLNNYLKTIDGLKDEFKGKLKIYKGLEIDYLPFENRFEKYKYCNLDYSIGAVHMLWSEKFNKYFSVDSTLEECKELIEVVYGSAEGYVRGFYSTVRDLIRQGGFDILAHFDLIKKFNRGERFFTEKENWYVDEVIKTLDLLKEKDLILEVNTGAIAKGYREIPYPSLWILNECKQRDIKICLNSDVHSPDKIDYFFDEALEIILDSGYTKLHTPFEVINIRR